MVEVALSYVSPLHDPPRAEVLKAQVDEGRNDTYDEDPFRDGQVNGGVDLRRPVIEGEQVDGNKGIDAVDGNGYEEQEPEIAVGEWCEATGGLEIFEVLGKVLAAQPGEQ